MLEFLNSAEALKLLIITVIIAVVVGCYKIYQLKSYEIFKDRQLFYKEVIEILFDIFNSKIKEEEMRNARIKLGKIILLSSPDKIYNQYLKYLNSAGKDSNGQMVHDIFLLLVYIRYYSIGKSTFFLFLSKKKEIKKAMKLIVK